MLNPPYILGLRFELFREDSNEKKNNKRNDSERYMFASSRFFSLSNSSDDEIKYLDCVFTLCSLIHIPTLINWLVFVRGIQFQFRYIETTNRNANSIRASVAGVNAPHRLSVYVCQNLNDDIESVARSIRFFAVFPSF